MIDINKSNEAMTHSSMTSIKLHKKKILRYIIWLIRIAKYNMIITRVDGTLYKTTIFFFFYSLGELDLIQEARKGDCDLTYYAV